MGHPSETKMLLGSGQCECGRDVCTSRLKLDFCAVLSLVVRGLREGVCIRDLDLIAMATLVYRHTFIDAIEEETCKVRMPRSRSLPALAHAEDKAGRRLGICPSIATIK